MLVRGPLLDLDELAKLAEVDKSRGKPPMAANRRESESKSPMFRSPYQFACIRVHSRLIWVDLNCYRGSSSPSTARGYFVTNFRFPLAADGDRSRSGSSKFEVRRSMLAVGCLVVGFPLMTTKSPGKNPQFKNGTFPDARIWTCPDYATSRNVIN